MEAVCYNRDQYVRELDGHLETMQKPEMKYSFEKGFLDLTGFGTLYQMGADFAHLARTNRVFEWLNQNEKFARGPLQYTAAKTAELVLREGSERKVSIASKFVYLGSLISLVWLPYNPFSAVGCIGTGSYFMFKAGFASYESASEARIQSLRNQLV